MTNWTLFNETNLYENVWFFGLNTTNLTATTELFLNNPKISFWQFEVIYQFVSKSGSSALNTIINQSPYNGSCSISSLNGTTNTFFNILCLNWLDEYEIKDYSLYSKLTNKNK
jgi:hypothetical protein